MIAHFYKAEYGNGCVNNRLIATKNIESAPPVKTIVVYNGQKFSITKLEFDLSKSEYNIYMCRA